MCVCCFRCPCSVFHYASSFNQALGEWDVARVTDMRYSECLVCWPILAAAGSRVFFYIADNPLFFRFSLCVCCFRCPPSVFHQASAFNQDPLCGASWVYSGAYKGYMFTSVTRGWIATSVCSCSGGYWQFSTSQCIGCPAGRFNAKTSGSTTEASCKGCSVGRFNDQDGQETCKYCETGRFNNKTGQAACKLCVTGKSNAGTGNTDCAACPAGRVVHSTLPLHCKICPAGMFQPLVHLNYTVTCAMCPTGLYIDDPATIDIMHSSLASCLACPKGREFVNRTTECTICAAGRFQNSSTKPGAVCSSCPSGRYLLDTEDTQAAEKHVDVTQCLTCPKGREFVNRTTECAICAAGRFQNSNSLQCNVLILPSRSIPTRY